MTLDEIFKNSPKLKDIAKRLADSEKEVNAYNDANGHKTKIVNKLSEGNYTPITKRTYGVKYPDHFQITAAYHDGEWDTIVSNPASGRDNFETALVEIVESYNPKGIRVTIYKGKLTTSKSDTHQCWISSDAANDPDIKRENELSRNASIGLGEKVTELERVIREYKTNAPIPTFSMELLNVQFEQKLDAIKHEQQVTSLREKHERELEKLNTIIEAQKDEISELVEQIGEQDEELGSAAELIEQKQKPAPMLSVFASALETAAVKLCMHHPKLLGAFGLNDEQIKEIFAEQNKQIESTETTGAASFTEFKEVPKYENQTLPEHIEAAASVTALVNNLNLENFRLLYTLIIFCYTEGGEFLPENVNYLIAQIHAKKSADRNEA